MQHLFVHRARLRASAALLLLLVMSFGFTAAQESTPAQTEIHTETGLTTFIGAAPDAPIYVGGVAGANGAAVNTELVLARLAPQFGVNDVSRELAFTRELASADGRVTRRYAQMYNGIPVFGGALVVNTRPDGGLVTMAGEISPNLNISTTPKLTAPEIRQIAKGIVARNLGVAANTLKTNKPALNIYDERLLTPSDQPARLVYHVVVTSRQRADISYTLLVDAQNGRALLNYANYDTHWGKAFGGQASTGADASGATGGADLLPMPEAPKQDNAGSIDAAAPAVIDAGGGIPQLGGAPKIQTYTANKTTTIPGTLLCNQGKAICTNGVNADADNAHRYARDTYNFFWNVLGRDSINAFGMVLISTTDYEPGATCNAFWNGNQMVYYDRCPGGTVVLDDVVAHELTHGVTEYTASLIYAYQSGAINESVSDVFGELIDQMNGTPEDVMSGNAWKIGEPNFYIRDMADPHIHGQPKSVYDVWWYYGSGDNGGVHYNSGVGNYMAYLMVGSMGRERTAHVWYEALTNILFPGSNYRDLGNALVQACNNLVGQHGITSSHCSSVSNHRTTTNMTAVTAVAGSPATFGTLCPTATATYLFWENFETNTSRWTFSAQAGPNAWRVSNQQPLTGKRSLVGRDHAKKSVSQAAMNVNIRIQPKSYLAFYHDFRFEQWNSVYYDGGYVEYSIDNGATWLKLSSSTAGQGYNGSVHSSNPRSGRNPMFVGYTKNGTAGTNYSSTRFDLSALAGKNARFRWVISTDVASGSAGWTIDDVMIYTCTGLMYNNVLTNTSFENGSGALMAPWVMANGTGDNATCVEGGYVGSCALRFRGNANELASVTQTHDLASYPVNAGQILYVDGYYASTFVGKAATAVIRVRYTDGTSASFQQPLYGAVGWNYFFVTGRVSNKPIQWIKVDLKHHATYGFTYFDSIWMRVYHIALTAFAPTDEQRFAPDWVTADANSGGTPENPPTGGGFEIIPMPAPPTENQ